MGIIVPKIHIFRGPKTTVLAVRDGSRKVKIYNFGPFLEVFQISKIQFSVIRNAIFAHNSSNDSFLSPDSEYIGGFRPKLTEICAF